MTIRHPRHTAVPLVVACVEALPPRTLLSSAPAVTPALAARLQSAGFESTTWHGHSVYAEPGEWIVSVRGMHGPQAMQVALLSAKLKRLGRNLHVDRQLGQDGLFRISAPAAMSGAALKATLRNVRNFEYVEPNTAVWVQDDGPPLPDDPLFAQQYALNNTGTPGNTADADIDAPEAWAMAAGAQEVVIGEIDTGVDYNHPDLAGGMWVNPGEIPGDGKDNDENGFVDDIHGADFSEYPNFDGDPMDEHGHGTHVAGILAARQNNGVGVAGVAPNAKVMALRFLRADGFGDTDGAVAAINYAMDMKDRGVNVRVLNASWGSGEFSESLDRAIRNAGGAGMLFVAAAGNGGVDEKGDNNDLVPFFPASYDQANIISVAATDSRDALGGLSNYGPTSVDLAAPGLLILSTFPNNRYGQLSGTSMATPHVSGTAAMLFGTYAGSSWQRVQTAIFNSADRIASMAGKTVTGGRLNAAGALRAMLPPAVVGRHVFYNASGFDGRSAAAGPEDDAAIAADKSALLPGQVGSFANYTSYSKGINGVMADLVNPRGAIDAADFAFAVRTATGDWAPAPAPAGVSTRAGAGDDGSDRVTITWADGSIKDTWLRVTVLADADTGLAQPDVFYFGNAVGETGNSPLDAAVNALDVAATRAAQHAGDVLIDNVYDFNRDRVVNSLDLAVVRGRQLLTALPLITVPPIL